MAQSCTRVVVRGVPVRDRVVRASVRVNSDMLWDSGKCELSLACAQITRRAMLQRVS